MSARPAIVVVGAGVSGLTSALLLGIDGFAVRVVAERFTPHTTSDVAAAVWYPFRVGPRDKALRWGARSFERFLELADDPAAGVTVVPGIEVLAEPSAEAWWATGLEEARPARPEELPPGARHGRVFRAPVVAMPAYMAWLMAQVLAAGCVLEEAWLGSLADVFEGADAVVHCTGLGARELAGDPSVRPIRGQIVRVAAGHARRFVQDTAGGGPPTYIIPRPDCTVLGGTTDEGVWDLAPDPEVAQAIRARCEALEPTLKNAATLGHAVGLRPGRPQVRLEVTREGGGPPIVHNYGHGGAGVTLSWGCAADVRDLVAAALRG